MHADENPDTGGESAEVTSGSSDEIEAGKTDLHELTAIADEFNAAFNTALYELESSRKLISERSARIDELNESIRTLSSSLDEETSNGRRKDEDYAREKADLNESLDELRRTHDNTCAELDSLRHELETRSNELATSTGQVEEYAREKATLNESLDELRRTHDSTCAELDSLRHELETRSNELATFSDRVEELSAELASVKEASERREGEQREEINRLGAEVRQLNETLQQRNDQFKQREEELVARADKLHSLNRTLHESVISESDMFARAMEEREREIDSLRSQLASAGEAPVAMAAAGEQAEMLQNAINDLEGRLRESEDQRHALGARAQAADELENEVARLTTALQETGAPGDTTEEMHAALEDITRLEAEVERLNAALAEAGNAAAQESAGTEELEFLRQQLAEIQSALENTQAERDALGERLAGHEALEQEVQGLREALEQSGQGQQEQAGDSAAVEALNSEVASLKSALATAEEKCAQLEATREEDGAAPVAAEEVMTLSLEPVEQAAPDHDDSPDREKFLAHLGRILGEPRNAEGSGTVMYVLVDNFVRIRDEIGIMNSEQVITEVSGMIRSHCEGNMVTRFGDCSFAVLCEDEDKEVTREKAERIRVAIESHIFEVAGQSLITTTSIGVCSIRKGDSEAEKVVARADLACESARTSGGNQVLVSSAVAENVDMETHNSGHADIVSKILAEDRIKIYYQPISSLIDKESQCYEVLTRIVDEDGNIILPGEFFSMAVNSGQAMEVDLHVIENIMRMMSENPGQPMTLFIKLTRQTVASQDFAVWLMEKTRHYRISADKLVFEVAEGMLQNELKNLSMLSKALSSIGCKLAIEHYRMDTQPQHLQHIEADYLKIDSGLVQNISNKGKCFTKVTEIMEVARSNNFITIAEGVESPATLAILWELGVSLAQGYFIQAPTGDMQFADDSTEARDEEREDNKATFVVS